METTTDKPSKRVYHFAQILPDNDRVRKKLEIQKYEEEEKTKVQMERDRLKMEEINNDELIKQMKLDNEKQLKQKEMENQAQDIKSRFAQIQLKV